MVIANLTPHAIVLRAADGADTIIAPSGAVARVTSVPGVSGTVDGVPVPVWTADAFGEVIDLPEPQPGTLFLVSAMVGGAVAGTRDDVVVPGTGPNDGAVRNEKGHIVAVTRLKRV